MKKITLLCSVPFLLVALQTNAADRKHMMPIQQAMDSATYKERLDPNIALYFGDQSHGEVSKSFGGFTTNQKTNAFNKSDEEACEWVMLSALLSLQERARKEGGNAVINISSYYKKNIMKSDTEYECHAGAIIAGVALKGDVVKIDK